MKTEKGRLKYEFTFHYGPIQILSVKKAIPSLMSFTFHYGPIQIKHTQTQFNTNYIYIPLWSYSNSFMNCIIFSVIAFTFHYGPIQMDVSKT